MDDFIFFLFELWQRAESSTEGNTPDPATLDICNDDNGG
jgi:hypothetical protein